MMAVLAATLSGFAVFFGVIIVAQRIGLADFWQRDDTARRHGVPLG